MKNIPPFVLAEITPINAERVSRFNELQTEIYENLLRAVAEISKVKDLSRYEIIARWNEFVDLAEKQGADK